MRLCSIFHKKINKRHEIFFMLSIFLKCFQDKLFAGVSSILSFCNFHEFYVVVFEVNMNSFCESFDQIYEEFKSTPFTLP